MHCATPAFQRTGELARRAGGKLPVLDADPHDRTTGSQLAQALHQPLGPAEASGDA